MKAVLKYDEIRDITDYPEQDGYYFVFVVNDITDEVESVKRTEFVQLDEEYPSMYQGWDGIQYEVENDVFKRLGKRVYWCEELKFV